MNDVSKGYKACNQKQGCLGKMAHFCDANAILPKNKLLTHRSRCDDGYLGIKNNDGDHGSPAIFTTTRDDGSNPRPGSATVKKLMADEMLGSNHSAPNVIARLMGLEYLPLPPCRQTEYRDVHEVIVPHDSANEKLRRSREFHQALEVLNCNKDLFIRFLEDRNWLFSRDDIVTSKRVALLRPGSDPDIRTQQKPTRIVVLKPRRGGHAAEESSSENGYDSASEPELPPRHSACSVADEARKRLSARWAVVTNGDESRSRKGSTTLGEMLGLPTNDMLPPVLHSSNSVPPADRSPSSFKEKISGLFSSRRKKDTKGTDRMVSPDSVLEPRFGDGAARDDGGLIGKSPRIESVSRVGPSRPVSGEDERDWLHYVRGLLSASGFDADSVFRALSAGGGWMSHGRLVYDCLSEALAETDAGRWSSPGLVERVRDRLVGLDKASDGEECIGAAAVEQMARSEIVSRRGWWEELMRLEVDGFGRDIECFLVEGLVEEVVIQLIGFNDT